jgi:hypothetical protein
LLTVEFLGAGSPKCTHFYDDGAVEVSRCSRCWCFRGSRRVSVSSFIAIRCISSEGRRKESAIVILSRSISLFRAFELMALNLRKSPSLVEEGPTGAIVAQFSFFHEGGPHKIQEFYRAPAVKGSAP